nr:hypothetical protein CFP56_01152 [Quercus suber]
MDVVILQGSTKRSGGGAKHHFIRCTPCNDLPRTLTGKMGNVVNPPSSLPSPPPVCLRESLPSLGLQGIPSLIRERYFRFEGGRRYDLTQQHPVVTVHHGEHMVGARAPGFPPHPLGLQHTGSLEASRRPLLARPRFW